MPALERNAYPARFNVKEKICLKCGEKYYASRNTAKYCSNTCRAHAHADRAVVPVMRSGGTIPPAKVKEAVKTQIKQQDELFIAWDTNGLKLAEEVWANYFPEIKFDDVWEDKITYGNNDNYLFNVITGDRAKREGKANGCYIRPRQKPLFR